MRGKEYNVEMELLEIVEKKQRKQQGGERSVLKSIFSKDFLLPFVKIGILMSLSQWAGINILSSYLVTVFEVQTRITRVWDNTNRYFALSILLSIPVQKEAGSSLDPSLAPILVSAIQLVLSILSSFVLRFYLSTSTISIIS